MIVRFFAQTRGLTGCDEVELTVDQTINEDELWRRLDQRFPGIGGTRGETRLARNQEFVGAGTTFSGTDEVALIPPVSGG